MPSPTLGIRSLQERKRWWVVVVRLDAVGADNERKETDVAATSERISFDQDIKPLFREKDRESMMSVSHFDLWSYDDVAQQSDAIQARLRDGSMPCDGAWPDEQVALFQDWIAAGKPA
jgi:hypothetical protein